VATEQVYLLLFGAVVLVIVFVAFFVFALQRLRRRKARLLDELKHSPRLNSDRAFNRLEMARREADILARQGTDIARARELIADSQSAMDLRQFERAYELAQSAHESLVAARQGRVAAAPLPTSEPMTPRTGRTVPGGMGGAPLPSSSDATRPAPPSTGLPQNRVESQFEMRLLDSDLAQAQQIRPTDPATLAGIDFQRKARTAFDAGQYTEAFRYALKGRRGLGGNVEAVASGPTTVAPGSVAEAIDPAGAAERAASATRCPSCGYPTSPDDAFCRGCGTPRVPAACQRCGTPRTPEDTFCGRCGERFS
jgi:hypothetical protein